MMNENIQQADVHGRYGALCPSCDKSFTPSNRLQRFCSTSCRVKYHAEARRIGEAILAKEGKGSHFARLSHSPRLQRVLQLLHDREWRSTREIIYKANVCAVNTCIHELRQNGFIIEQRYGKTARNEKKSEYRLAWGVK